MLSIIAGLRRIGSVAVCCAALVAAIGVAGCDKLPLLAPQQSTITLSSASTVIQANGATEVRATVLEQGGTPVQNGTTVTFTTTLGSLSPVDARTTNGVATVQFLGNGQSGKASIKAISGGAQTTTPLEISVGAAAAGRVTLTANPTSVPASGGSTTISAAVTDASGNPLASVPVTFATTAGTFSSAVVNTDSAGIARTTLTTNAQASVTATSGASTSAALTISTIARPTASISLASGSTPSVGGITTFSIVVTPATGGAPIQNVNVNYGDGSSDDLGSVSGTLTVQHVYQDDGSFTPTVTVTDTSGSQPVTASTVIVVQPLLVSITAAQDSGDPQTFTFTANVTPASATIASYAWTFGDGSSATTSSATTSHRYTSSGNKTVRVTARTTTNRTAAGSTTISVP